MGEHVMDFLMKSVLGMEVEPGSPMSVRRRCVERAYDDMMTAGRYLGIKEKERRCDAICALLEDAKWRFDRRLIGGTAACFDADAAGWIAAEWRTGTAYGLAQKVVNMTFKYLYVFRSYIDDMPLDFTGCDCPVDSIVLKRLGKLPGEERETVRRAVWSKLTEGEYVTIQSVCDRACETDEAVQRAREAAGGCSPRLLYDFFTW